MKYYFLSFVVILFCNILDAKDLERYSSAKIQVLNKLTGKYDKILLTTDVIHQFDNNLYIVLKACYKPLQKDDIENSAFFEVMKTYDSRDAVLYKNKPVIPMPFYFKNLSSRMEKAMIFSGWMFSSSPSLSHMLDNTYDLILIKCENNLNN
jgi:hypothetical protein